MLIVPAKGQAGGCLVGRECGFCPDVVNTYGITHDRYQQGIQSLVLIFIGLGLIAIIAMLPGDSELYLFSERQAELLSCVPRGAAAQLVYARLRKPAAVWPWPG
jgi:hypothetical protein